MNLGHETETVEFKRSTSELREGMESIASILNKHGHGELYFGVRTDGEVVGQDVSEKTLCDVSQVVGNRIEPRIYPIVEERDDGEGRAYVERGNKCGRIAFAYTDVENVLSRLALILNGKLTNAAEVLFCPSITFQLSMGLLGNHA